MVNETHPSLPLLRSSNSSSSSSELLHVNSSSTELPKHWRCCCRLCTASQTSGLSAAAAKSATEGEKDDSRELLGVSVWAGKLASRFASSAGLANGWLRVYESSCRWAWAWVMTSCFRRTLVSNVDSLQSMAVCVTNALVLRECTTVEQCREISEWGVVVWSEARPGVGEASVFCCLDSTGVRVGGWVFVSPFLTHGCWEGSLLLRAALVKAARRKAMSVFTPLISLLWRAIGAAGKAAGGKVWTMPLQRPCFPVCISLANPREKWPNNSLRQGWWVRRYLHQSLLYGKYGEDSSTGEQKVHTDSHF